MRRRTAAGRCRAKRRSLVWLAAAVLLAGALHINRYVNTVIKPTLHELAEYEARAATVQAVNRAVAAELSRQPALCSTLFADNGGVLCLDAARAGTAQAALIAAVQAEMDALPEISYRVPFGSLTNNSLLSGLGPGWPVQLQPQGYVQGEIRQTTESLSINTTRYCAVLHLSVTVNMILDGSTATLTVEQTCPLVSLLAGGEIPDVYATGQD